MLSKKTTVLLALCTLWLGAIACSGDDDKPPAGVTLQGETACQRWASLATAVGCSAVQSCVVSAECESQARAWIDCAATDLDQCSCESDGALNCEGSHKPNEGPARCVAESEALGLCEDG